MGGISTFVAGHYIKDMTLDRMLVCVQLKRLLIEICVHFGHYRIENCRERELWNLLRFYNCFKHLGS